MFDPVEEKPIALADVPKVKWLPRRPHIASVFRWAQRGIKGHRLETMTICGAKCTSEERLKVFFERISDPAAAIQTTTTAQRTRQQVEVNRQCDRAGI